MTLQAWPASALCGTLRDCGCCGARGSLLCREPADHRGIHAFFCQRCGRDQGCRN